jgi:hypothetical protein
MSYIGSLNVRYDGKSLEELRAQDALTAKRVFYHGFGMKDNPYEAQERKYWEHLRAKAIREGANPLHPAFRFPDWTAFRKAGKPWHNAGEAGFRHMPWGDNSRRWEHLLFHRPKRPPFEPPMPDPGLKPVSQSPSVAFGGVPASVMMQWLNEAKGGAGASTVTPTSPERMVQDYVNSIMNGNGFKSPGNIRTA